jgi:ankyrin repeat protein
MYGNCYMYIYPLLDISTGVTYSGQFRNGKRFGQGKLVRPGGFTYEGEWKNDMMSGTGTLHQNNGDVYHGSFSFDLKSGHGVQHFHDGSEYDGEWKGNTMSGVGAMRYPDGRIYLGGWNAGKMAGDGAMTSPDGTVYEGNWVDGQMEGAGRLTESDGEYEGSFKKGLKDGEGKQRFNDGSLYEGQWMKGKMHGSGKLISSNGHVFEGTFRNGEYKTGITAAIDYSKPNRKAVTPEDKLRSVRKDLEALRFSEALRILAEDPEVARLCHVSDMHMAEELLELAAMEGNTQAGINLIHGGVDINHHNLEKATPLFLASKAGHREIVNFLMTNGANLNAKVHYGTTPLIAAIDGRHFEIVKSLINAGADISISQPGCTSALVALVAQSDHNQIPGPEFAEVLELLIQNDVVVKDRCLNIAIRDAVDRRSGLVLEKLINAIMAAGTRLPHGNQSILHALTRAIESRSLDFVLMILEKVKVDLNSLNQRGESLLEAVAMTGTFDMVKFLVEQGASVKVGFPLHKAALRGDSKIVEYLIEAGALVDRLDTKGASPVANACNSWSHPTSTVLTLQTLLNHGSTVGKEDCFRLSAARGRLQLIRIILNSSSGLLIDEPNTKGETALILAAQNGHINTVEFLTNLGVDLNIEDSSGLSAVGWAHRRNHEDIFRYLLSKGAVADPECIQKFVFEPRRKVLEDQRVNSLRNGGFNHQTSSLVVRREFVLDDSIEFLTRAPWVVFTGPSYVRFDGEAGIDAGGLRKDWLSAIGKNVFSNAADGGLEMFKKTHDGIYIGLNQQNGDNHDRYFAFGRYLGIAILNKKQVPVPLSPLFYAKLLHNEVTMHDLERYYVERYTALNYLRNTAKVAGTHILVQMEEIGDFDTPELDSPTTMITNGNAALIVQNILDAYFAGPMMDAIRNGFNDLIPIAYLNRNGVGPELLRKMIFGPETVNVDMIIDTMEIDRTVRPDIIHWLQEWLKSASQENLRYFLRFVTGNPQVPTGGFSDSNHIQVGVWTAANPDDTLPRSHTCFSKIDLPSNATTQKKFNDSMDHAVRSEGFGIG